MEPIEEPPLTAELIRARHQHLVARLRTAAEVAGRDPDRIGVVAVTKGFGVDVVRAAAEAGLERLGENRVQEAAAKIAAVPGVEWHLLGRLQSNKVRPAVRAFAVIHAVDSLDQLQRIDRIASEEGHRTAVYLQVNTTREPSKAGFDLDWIATQAAATAGTHGELAAALRALHTARAMGLMTIGPLGAGEEAARGAFATLRRLRDALEQASGIPLPELSMGMTADAEAAVAEGATLVRVGTALFGPRPPASRG